MLENPEYLSRAQIGELENLKHRKQSLQQESKAARQRVQVRRILASRTADTKDGRT